MQTNPDRADARFFSFSRVLKTILLVTYIVYCGWLQRHYKMEIANLSGMIQIRFWIGAAGVILSSLSLWACGRPFTRYPGQMSLGCILLSSVLVFPFWISGIFYDLHLLCGFGGTFLYLSSLLRTFAEQYRQRSFGQKERQAFIGLVFIGFIAILIAARDYHISGNMELFFCLSLSMYFYALELESAL